MTSEAQHIPRTDRSRWWALALVALVSGLAACGEPPEPGPAPRLKGAEGDQFRARILGFAIDKPETWTFLPGSSLKKDAETPSDDMVLVQKRLHRAGVVPLVAMAPEPDAVATRAPVVEVHAMPSRPQDVSMFTHGAEFIPPEKVLSSRILERGRNPDFEVVEEAKRVDLGGQPAAVARLTYRKQGENGDEQQVEELMWHFRRGKVFFYLIQTAPAPLSEELVKTFEGIAQSVRIDS